MGSQARREPTLRTDQDHALLLSDAATAGDESYFAIFAEELVATLAQCGLERCPGNVMATNPAWRVRRQAWRDRAGAALAQDAFQVIRVCHERVRLAF